MNELTLSELLQRIRLLVNEIANADPDDWELIMGNADEITRTATKIKGLQK